MQLRFATMVHPPKFHDGLLACSATAPVDPLFEITSDATQLFVPRGIEQGQVMLTPVRKNAEFKDKLVVVPIDVPAAISLAIKEENDVYTLMLAAPTDAPFGNYSVVVGAFGTFQGRGQLVRFNLPVEVNNVLSAEVQAAGTLPIGGAQQLRVKLTRRGRDRQPVMISLEGLPAGITAVAASLPADQDEATIEVKADANAAVGQYAGIRAIATTTYSGHDARTEAAFGLDVVAQ